MLCCTKYEYFITFRCGMIFHGRDLPHVSYPFICRGTFALFPPFGCDIRIQVFVWTDAFIFLGRYLGEELLGPLVTQCLTVWRKVRLFSKAVAVVCSCQWCMRVPVSPNPCQYLLLWVFMYYYYSHPTGCEALSRLLWICVSPKIPLHVLIGHLCIFFGERSLWSLFPVFNWATCLYYWVVRVPQCFIIDLYIHVFYIIIYLNI